MESWLIHTTLSEDQIFVAKGSKSQLDFIVKYRSPGKRLRTPKHIHLVVDLYAKLAGNENLSMKFIDHVISMIEQMQPVQMFPPRLQFFSKEQLSLFDGLDMYGEYSVEFLLVVIELIMLEEKTNYPNGTLNLRIFRNMREKADIYSVVSAATFR
jgi:hypothetical protein